MKWLSKYHFGIAVVLLIGLRFLHFGSSIDAPHEWRQCDTANYIWDFYQYGVNLLYPSVCWMGGYKTLILEFPLPEAVVALTFQIVGDSIFGARFLFLSFFLLAVYFFYRIVKLAFDSSLAKLAALIYLALPLSLFYSRAIHIDFCALFLAYALLFYFMKAVNHKSNTYLLISALAGILAFLVKVPYVFYLALPMLVYAVQQKQLRWVVRRSWMYLPAIVVFVIWQQHVYAVNGAAPDWDYIFSYRKFDQNSFWYFGNWEQRMSLYHWWVLLKRGVLEVAGPGSIVFFLIGLFRIRFFQNKLFIIAWMIGIGIYVLIFFNLNFVHNYYQLPLLAPVSVVVAMSIQWLESIKPYLLPLALLCLVILNLGFTESQYYHVDEQDEMIGTIIRQHTNADDLVIISYARYDCRNPKLLFRARRNGWSIEELAINAEVIGRLWKEEGADYWAYIGKQSPLPKVDAVADSLKEPVLFTVNDSLQLYLFTLDQ